MPAPSIELNSFDCPHCGAHAQQFWYNAYVNGIENNGIPFRHSAEDIEFFKNAKDLSPEIREAAIENALRSMRGEIFFDGKISLYDRPQLINISVSRCYSCKRLSLWVHNRVVYPALRVGAAPNPDLPADILGDYEEARSIVDLSPRGAAALLRLSIQKLCKYLGQTGKNINDDIAALVKKGLDIRVQRALDIVRVIGNDAVHPGQIDLRDDHSTANQLFGLVNVIAEKMISEPKHIQSIYDALPLEKREAIEKRDKS